MNLPKISSYKIIVCIACAFAFLMQDFAVSEAYVMSSQKVGGAPRGDEELIEALQSTDQEVAHGAAVAIVAQGEESIALLLRCRGNKKNFFGYGLGDRNSGFLIPLPTGNARADDGRVITIEVAALYLVSAIYYESLEFAQAPFLTDGTPTKRQRFNTARRVSEAWKAVTKWADRLRTEGMVSLRRSDKAPLSGSGVHFWGTSP